MPMWPLRESGFMPSPAGLFRLFRHFWLKVLAVIVALLLWLVVSGEQTVERSLRVPLELQQFPPQLELVDEPPASVDIRVRGTSGDLGRVSVGEIVAVIDLRGARPGRRLFHLTPEQVRVPFGLEVVQVSPATIALAFEESATRHVPVKPSLDGRPAPGFVVGTVQTDPPTVELVGPESAITRATEALTEPVSIAGARSRVIQTVTIGTGDVALRLKNPRTATVSVLVVPGPFERVLRSVPVRLRNVAPNLSPRVVPPVVAASVRGSREALDGLGPDEVSLFVDLAGLGVGQYDLTVHSDERERMVGITRIDPGSVSVTLK